MTIRESVELNAATRGGEGQPSIDFLEIGKLQSKISGRVKYLIENRIEIVNGAPKKIMNF